MLTSIAIIFIFAIIVSFAAKRLRLPALVGMLLIGMIIGPYGLNLIHDGILNQSTLLRQVVLIIILIRAGLSLHIKELKTIGRPAVLMAFIPAAFEILAYYLLAPKLLPIEKIDALLLGSVMAAVSPAVVVPHMVTFIRKDIGTNKHIPQLIMAGASCDDIFVIVLFSSFLTLALGGNLNLLNLVEIPVSIVSGIAIGAFSGYVFSRLLNQIYRLRLDINKSEKVLLFLSCAFLFMTLETLLTGFIPFSGLLAVMSFSLLTKFYADHDDVFQFAEHFERLWVAFEILLFVLVGAIVDIKYALNAGVLALLLITIALVFRGLGVYLCLIGTALNTKERLFVVISYMPKATVQAAIGAIPLSAGVASGNLILAMALLAIIFTAPLGALGIRAGANHLLIKETSAE